MHGHTQAASAKDECRLRVPGGPDGPWGRRRCHRASGVSGWLPSCADGPRLASFRSHAIGVEGQSGWCDLAGSLAAAPRIYDNLG
jgi:hypothetical protein